ncbi:MAG: glycosyltransferase [Leptolyngbyaceae cyanobacterium bins.59]|nr:glycosyltransferase [Leptolyngbyaceae cyanobacterium bins.59]
MPLISVIIPAYNAEKTITETVQSVLSQTFTDFEVIVINDGSQDDTLEVLSTIQDDRLRVISQVNGGAQKARNRGIQAATGAYIALLDADDLWTRDKLATQIKALEEDPTAGVAYSWMNRIDEQGHFLRRGSYHRFSGNVFAHLLLIDFIENGSNPLIRTQAFDEVGLFDETLSCGQDWDMWLRLAARYPFVVIPSVHTLYRKTPNSISSKLEQREAGYLKVIHKALTTASPEVKALKPHIIGNRYKCLIIDALNGSPSPQRALIAAQFLWTVIQYDPSLLHSRIFIKILLIIAIMLVLPPKPAMQLLQRKYSLFDISTLGGYLKLDVPPMLSPM